MLKRIAITGPESTGKSQLAKELAAHYQANYVSEFAREYLGGKQGKYTIGDILAIAKGQLRTEEGIAAKASGLLFCDTDMLVTKIWSRFVFNECPEWIEEMFIEHRYDLYLLCYPDLDWEPDPLRKNPKDRLSLFEQYKMELQHAGFNFAVVKGRGAQRLKNALNFVRRLESNSRAGLPHRWLLGENDFF
ncbi:MAG: ATP-binding protein [Bacteroidales bacterium]|nr:ATP-binding protein [Bacteroidales bacterium]